MLLQFLKLIQHFPEIFVKFSQNDLTIFPEPFLTLFIYNACFIYKIRFLVLEPSSNFFQNILIFWNFFYNMHEVLFKFSPKIVFTMFLICRMRWRINLVLYIFFQRFFIFTQNWKNCKIHTDSNIIMWFYISYFVITHLCGRGTAHSTFAFKSRYLLIQALIVYK